MSNINTEPFWKKKQLSEMSQDEWESLCDGCGLCCLIKLEDEDSGDVYHTRLTCRLLDVDNCQCSNYKNRHEIVPDCLRLTPETIQDIFWLPKTCAYRVLYEGKSLAWWHPLVSGDGNTVHEAGISVRDWAMNETKVPGEAYFKYIIHDDIHEG